MMKNLKTPLKIVRNLKKTSDDSESEEDFEAGSDDDE